MQQMNPLLRGRDADHGRIGGLGVLPVGAGRLAERRCVADDVEQVVLNLKCQADGGGEASSAGIQARCKLRARTRPPSARWHG